MYEVSSVRGKILFKKILVFIGVVIFHAALFAVVYLVTEESVSDDSKNDNQQVTESIDKPSATTSEVASSSQTNPPVNSVGDTSSSSSSQVEIYVVQKGDFLGKIASKYKVTSKAIMELNNLKNANKIFLGQKLKIPAK